MQPPSFCESSGPSQGILAGTVFGSLFPLQAIQLSGHSNCPLHMANAASVTSSYIGTCWTAHSFSPRQSASSSDHVRDSSASWDWGGWNRVPSAIASICRKNIYPRTATCLCERFQCRSSLNSPISMIDRNGKHQACRCQRVIRSQCRVLTTSNDSMKARWNADDHSLLTINFLCRCNVPAFRH
jgi:hypothetical protein